jgi:hypothetical protein
MTALPQSKASRATHPLQVCLEFISQLPANNKTHFLNPYVQLPICNTVISLYSILSLYFYIPYNTTHYKKMSYH